jgi:hypothetical protein
VYYSYTDSLSMLSERDWGVHDGFSGFSLAIQKSVHEARVRSACRIDA